jgi:hypothetical protein
MPVGAQKIFPIDRRPGIAVGVNLPFNAPAVFNSTYTTQDAVRNNLINFFLTNRNERYLNNLFGLEDIIQEQLKSYFPTVKVQSLEILSDPDRNSLTVDLRYNIVDTNIEDEIQLQFN